MSGFVKICGLTDAASVEWALAAGADAIGFVFADSPRRVTPRLARELALPARGRALCVAVTLHPDQDAIDAILADFAPDALQTDAGDFGTLRLPRSLPRLPVLRAGASAPLEPHQRRVLFEGPRSGSGHVADWQAAAALALQTDLILAGGLGPDNVENAIARVRPYGVDVSSGVESAPGRKDQSLIGSFVERARRAFATPFLERA